MGLSFSGRKITLSTCGIIPMIRQLGKDACLNLAVSLNAADNSTRNKLMPGNRQYPLERSNPGVQYLRVTKTKENHF